MGFLIFIIAFWGLGLCVFDMACFGDCFSGPMSSSNVRRIDIGLLF